MAEYLIPGAKDMDQAIAWAGSPAGYEWQKVSNGILVRNPAITLAAITALYSGYFETPLWRMPLPEVLRTHASHLKDFRDAVRAGTPLTNAQTLHVIADIIDYIRLTEDRL